MVAGGGGGGGRYSCGGGGAGGLVYTAGTSLAQGATKTIVVGNGDSGGNGRFKHGYNGKDTTFTDLDTASVVVTVGHKVPRVVPEDPVVVVDGQTVMVQVGPEPRIKVMQVVLVQTQVVLVVGWWWCRCRSVVMVVTGLVVWWYR